MTTTTDLINRIDWRASTRDERFGVLRLVNGRDEEGWAVARQDLTEFDTAGRVTFFTYTREEARNWTPLLSEAVVKDLSQANYLCRREHAKAQQKIDDTWRLP